jgi:hypothetical protein
MKKLSVWMAWLATILLVVACAGEPPMAAAPASAQATTLAPIETTSHVAQDEATAPPLHSSPTPPPSASAQAPTPSPSPSSPTPAPGELACEAGGYACSLAEVSKQVVTRAMGLSQDAEARMRGGDSAFAVAAWLEAQEGVVVEITDGRAIIYRVDGSVPIVVEHPGVEGSARRPAAVAAARYVPRPLLLGLAVPTNLAQPTISDPTDVVGSQREDRNVKRALVLAPYQWQVGAYGDGVVAAEMLEATRGYKGNVTYIANAQQSDQNVTVEHFMGWDQYDVIHVNTHGRSLCPEEGTCQTYLMTGQRIPKDELDAFIAQHPEIKGVGIGLRDRGEGIELVVFNDFFLNVYGPGSLKNKIIYFSACEVLAQSNVLDSLAAASENSDFFSWTYSVQADDAMAAASALYEKMAAQGQSAGDAYERIPDNVKLNRPSHAAEYDPYRYYGVEADDEGHVELIDRTQTTDFRHYAMGQETNHVREVITLLDPESKATLQPGAVYPMAGTLGDGDPERIELMFKVEGYTQQEIENEDLLISFLLDGEPIVAYRAFLPAQDDHTEVEAEGEFTWRVQFEEVEIPDQQPATALTFRAELQLPGGDPSVHEVAPVMTSQRDVRAIFGRPPLAAGQSYVVAFDRDSQVARADMSAEGQQIALFYDQALGRTYYPNPQGSYWYADSTQGEAFIAALKPVEWPPRQLEDAGFAHETYACGEERCDRYSAHQEGGEMILSYDENGLLVELEVSSPDGGGTVRYEYGPVSLTAPANASPAPAPIPFAGPSLPIPEQP